MTHSCKLYLDMYALMVSDTYVRENGIIISLSLSLSAVVKCVLIASPGFVKVSTILG